jgi:crotonobetaine/carnitine-CoA ligase
LESAAVAVPSNDSEDDILAVVVLRPGERLAEEDLIQHLADRLPYFMVPRYVKFVETLPRTPSQKIKKQELREVVGRGPKWDREEAGVTVPRR